MEQSAKYQMPRSSLKWAYFFWEHCIDKNKTKTLVICVAGIICRSYAIDNIKWVGEQTEYSCGDQAHFECSKQGTITATIVSAILYQGKFPISWNMESFYHWWVTDVTVPYYGCNITQRWLFPCSGPHKIVFSKMTCGTMAKSLYS